MCKSGFLERKRVYFPGAQKLTRRCTLRRELKVLDGGHRNVSWKERKAFFEEELNERVREAFLRDISTRQVGEALEPVLGEALLGADGLADHAGAGCRGGALSPAPVAR